MKKLMLLGVAILFLSGCSLGRQVAMDIERDDCQNIEDFKKSAENLLDCWLLNSGLIRGALGHHMSEMPQEVVEAMDELDALAKKWEALTDYEYGYAMGLRVRMQVAIILEFIQKYAPYLLQKFPFLFVL